jgi:Kef-type K+ transport system membrane component KefB
LLGLYLPEASAFLFPPQSLGALEFLSQIGLILFMFIIGMELDINILKKQAGSAIFISNVSIVVPFVSGAALALYLFSSFAPAGSRFIPFALFMGIALSITAFPVLARIVQERGITRTPLGITAITSAAINDMTAWGILAIIVAIANAGAIEGALFTIFLSLIFVLTMLLIIRPLLNKIAQKYTVPETISKQVVALVLSTMLLSAWITEVIGIHALFGAFMAGVIIPDNEKFKSIMAEKIEDISLVLLLPLFFVFTGLRTQIGLLNSLDLWLIALLVIAVAVASKFIGSAFAAKLTGKNWKDSLLIGALMNTRGLIELIALNIGYDIGVLSPEIFTILVLVALVTTFMTGPLMALIEYIFPAEATEILPAGTIKVLIAFGPPETGARLTQLIHSLFGNRKKGLKISALHLTPNTNISIKNARKYEEDAFREIRKLSPKLGIEVKKMYRTTENVSNEIVKTANRGKYDLLVVGSSRPLLNDDETSGRGRYFFENAGCQVGMFMDKGISEIKNILILTGTTEENQLFELTGKIKTQAEVKTLCLLPPSVPLQSNTDNGLQKIAQEIDTKGVDLIITTLSCYHQQRETGAAWIDGNTSVLLINKRGQD